MPATIIGKTATATHTEDGTTTVVYHKTPVVQFDREKIRLRSGGWRSATTKRRMNQASTQYGLHFRVFQKDFRWHVENPDGETVPFQDGMVIKR